MISDRIEALITHFCNGNKSLFAQKIGVRPSVIGNITGERKGNPSFEVVQKILDAFASVNPDWFILDKGTMLRSDTNQSVTLVDTAATSTSSDAIVLRLIDKLGDKDTKIEQLQTELRTVEKELMTTKSKLSQYESSLPPENPEKEANEDLYLAGNACSNITSQKSSSHTQKSDFVTAP